MIKTKWIYNYAKKVENVLHTPHARSALAIGYVTPNYDFFNLIFLNNFQDKQRLQRYSQAKGIDICFISMCTALKNVKWATPVRSSEQVFISLSPSD